MPIKVVVAAGTRPEAIKLAPVIRELGKVPGDFDVCFCATGQHREMFDQVLDAFDLRAHINLDVMRPDQRLAGLTATLLDRLSGVLTQEKPDWVIVQGDTTTTMAAALAAFYLRIPVAHVEAGLRTGNRFHPFPEEVNRRITDSIAELLFAPTARAAANLRAEGVPDSRILVTGNTGIDALLHIAGRNIPSRLDDMLAGLNGRRLIVVTTHRRENFNRPLTQICSAIRALATRHADVAFLLPVHLNPNVQFTVRDSLAGLPNVILTPPLDYVDFVTALKRAFVILTDSGGVQEEAPSLGKPVLVLRETTERQEAIEAGTARLVGTDEVAIVQEVERLLAQPDYYTSMAQVRNPFGDGRASARIVQALRQRCARADSVFALQGAHQVRLSSI